MINGHPFRYSCLGNPMDREAWQATVHEITKSQTRLKQLSMDVLVSSVQFSSVAQLCPALWYFHRQLPEFTQTHVHWVSDAISSSVVPFSSCPRSLAASGSFQVSRLFPSGGQGIGISGSASVLPVNTQDWSPLGWIGWISLQSKGLSRVFSNTTV